MTTLFAWLMVAATIALTCFGQIVIKWQVASFQPRNAGPLARLPALMQMLLQPWMLSAFAAAFVASLCWMLAMQRLELSKAYPFMALNFVIVCLLAMPLFGETFNTAKTIGLATVVIGLAILSQG